MQLNFVRKGMYVVLLSVTVLSQGCKKADAPAEKVQPASVPAAAPAPQPVAPVPAPAPAAATAAPAAAPGAAVSEPVKVGDVTIQATLGDGKSVDWALKLNEIKSDAAGQWAATATASSAYNDAKDQQRFAPWQVTGAPNVDQAGDNGNAWTAKTADSGIEWLQVGFAKPVSADGLRIRESENGGAIIKVELLDELGHLHGLWSGSDPTKALNFFMLTFPKTAYKVAGAKITLATNLVLGDNEIDAVQLLGAEN